jgi:hypothetical protein
MGTRSSIGIRIKHRRIGTVDTTGTRPRAATSPDAKLYGRISRQRDFDPELRRLLDGPGGAGVFTKIPCVGDLDALLLGLASAGVLDNGIIVPGTRNTIRLSLDDGYAVDLDRGQRELLRMSLAHRSGPAEDYVALASVNLTEDSARVQLNFGIADPAKLALARLFLAEVTQFPVDGLREFLRTHCSL